MRLSPKSRFALTVLACVVLIAGGGREHQDLRILFASMAVFYVLTYIAGGGRLPWKIKLREYLIYIGISLAVVGVIVFVAFYQARVAH